MRGRAKRTSGILLMLLCMGACFGCASGQSAESIIGITEEQELMRESSQEEQETEQSSLQEDSKKEEQKTEENVSGIVLFKFADETDNEEEYSPENQMKRNQDIFFEKAGKQGIDQQEGDTYLKVLADDNIFQDGKMELTGLQIDDIDGNGQKDMLVVVMDAQEKPFYGSGSLWIYINEDEPYCFSDEQCPYFGWYDVFWDDIDNDENVEIVYSAQGTGCGAVGDSYKAVFKYRDHAIEQMELPSDFEEDYDCGFYINVFQEPEADSYSAYCPYLDEWISFRGKNIEGWDLPQTAEEVGSNARGFYDLHVVEYEGKNVLQASEYLSGEGGTVHCVAIAQFLITWKEDGTPEVAAWWIEGDEDS